MNDNVDAYEAAETDPFVSAVLEALHEQDARTYHGNAGDVGELALTTVSRIRPLVDALRGERDAAIAERDRLRDTLRLVQPNIRHARSCDGAWCNCGAHVASVVVQDALAEAVLSGESDTGEPRDAALSPESAPCEECDGRGRTQYSFMPSSDWGTMQFVELTCTACKGSGEAHRTYGRGVRYRDAQ